MSTENDKAAGAVGMDAFFTRPKANAGIELPLWLPDGTKSGHWLRVLGIDSDLFRQAEAEMRRDAVRIAAIESIEERSKELEKTKRGLTAVLVIGWSFEQACTREAVEEFFLQAPHIMDAVDRAASKRALFFAHASSS